VFAHRNSQSNVPIHAALLFVSLPFDRTCGVDVSIYFSGACVMLQGQSLQVSESRSLCAVNSSDLKVLLSPLLSYNAMAIS